jgi:hypothetical protein
VFKAENLWYKLTIRMVDDRLLMGEVFSDKDLKINEDTSIYYGQPNGGALEQIYKHGKIVRSQLITQDGKIVGYAVYGDGGKTIGQKGFDENGKEIPNYIFAQEASFPGGANAWLDYIRANLNRKTPANNGAPAGTYRVNISFLIDRKGNVTDVKALSDPGYGTAQEAVRVISNSPKWNPAIQYNQTVSYRRSQSISFTVKSIKTP